MYGTTTTTIATNWHFIWNYFSVHILCHFITFPRSLKKTRTHTHTNIRIHARMHVQLYALHSHHGVDVFGIIQRSTIVCTWSLVKCNCITLFKLICIFRSVVEKIIIEYMSSIFCSMSYQVSMVFWIIQKNKKLFLFSECNWLMRKNGTTSDFPFWNWS